ncbi:MAG TPA: hypothetical protein DDX39_00580 [Bacteroidales bacterium]|nr:MAG: hypothetical protein A2W98_09685 [Bacteroidetes bacterium GWF2_33_38]OFY71612.1 MAG: hypothetical protein A2265_01100 [Bacteroidetes bacterium RIFOXYA12_FULL_33_9]OFY91212.1 MAG: hypothetical protein A2236_08605 [Bacteroidetes bacterium RIFOXYA2_FULL_33_7]HBF87106.1 hypothetical protein [Bacteroidales bacterium]
MFNECEVIAGCIKCNRKAQKMLFDKFSPVLFAICLRYSKSREEAEDVLQEGFVKIFSNIKQFKGEGSFEGWLKRIMINTAISNYRNSLKYYYHEEVENVSEEIANEEEPDYEYSMNDLMQLINELPDGYRVIFNMYVIEEYKHKEIAEILDIDVGTSKSQFSRAKKMLQKKLVELSEVRRLELVNG